MSKVCKMTLTNCQPGPKALMKFNTDEYVVLRLYALQAKDIDAQYQLNGERLRRVSHQHDSSVIVDEMLKLHHQCAKTAKSAN